MLPHHCTADSPAKTTATAEHRATAQQSVTLADVLQTLSTRMPDVVAAMKSLSFSAVALLVFVLLAASSGKAR